MTAETNMIDHHTTNALSMLKWYAGTLFTSVFSWLGTNSTGISALCTIICTIVVVWKFRDSRKDDNKDTPE